MKKRILAVPSMCFYSIIALCLIGIIIGSFFDFDISMVVANKTQLGTYFATFSPFFAYALFPAGGACLYVGLRKKRRFIQAAGPDSGSIWLVYGSLFLK